MQENNRISHGTLSYSVLFYYKEGKSKNELFV